ncbi:MAG: hypothetical protein N2513_02615 [Deltaproteobacteria bacterium]|nr:hypothetical protein [Deltaproteobacteria bacterium]
MKKHLVSFIIFSSLLFLLMGCGNEKKNLKEEIKILKEENAYLKAENKSLKKEIEELYKKIEEYKDCQRK